MRHLVLWGLLIAVILGIGAAYFLQNLRRATPSPEPLEVRGVIKPFTLTERSGRDVGLKDLEGSIWIADFIFTLCPGPCPKMSAEMEKLQKELPTDVRFVSFSVDPVTDTPEVLSAYAEKYGADKDRWWFLTGEKSKIWSIAYESFMLTVKESPGSPQNLTHDEHFCLVDRRGRLRGHYLHYDRADMARLRSDVKLLREEKP